MPSCKFYRLAADPAATSRWYLTAPRDPLDNRVDPRLFTEGLPVSSTTPLRVPLSQPGDEVGFNFAAFDMVVTPSEINSELQELVGSVIQRIPVAVEGSTNSFEILNVCALVPCLDEKRSLVTKWTDTDGRPDKIGQYRMINGLRIDPRIADGHHIFRIEGWPIALIVSESVKRLFENKNLSGVSYNRVD